MLVAGREVRGSCGPVGVRSISRGVWCLPVGVGLVALFIVLGSAVGGVVALALAGTSWAA